MEEILRAELASRPSPLVAPSPAPPLTPDAADQTPSDDEDDVDEAMSQELQRHLRVDARAVRLDEKHQAAAAEDVQEEEEEEEEEEAEEEDPNALHPLLNLTEFLLLDVLLFLDEESIVDCMCACHRLLHVARAEAVFETLCRRIFPVQNPRVAAAAKADRFALRKFKSWYHMFHDRPRVRYNGFYCLRVSYYKKPELNMWTEIVPGTILQVIYYRYFAFQRDGTVLYAMLFKPPHDATAALRGAAAALAEIPAANGTTSTTSGRQEVFRGRYHVEKDEVFVSVPTNHNLVEFRLKIDRRFRGHNTKLVLKEHYSFSEPNGTGWVDHFDTHDEEFHYWRCWDLC
jgi:F-box protein 9